MSSQPSAPLRLTVLLVAGSALLGAGLGFWLKPDRDSSSIPPTSGRKFKAVPKNVRQPSPRVVALLKWIRQAGSPDARITAALRLPEELESAEECQEFLENLNQYPELRVAEEMLAAVALRRWLELDSSGAVEWCLRRRPALAPQVLASLALSDPDKAEAALASLPAGPVLEQARREFASALAIRDPDRAWKFISLFPLQDLLPKLVAQDVAGTRERLADMAPALQPEASRLMVREWVKTDPQAAWQWARAQPDGTRLQREAVLAALSRTPEAACDFLTDLSVESACDLLQKMGDFRTRPQVNTAALLPLMRSRKSLDGYVREALLRVAYQDPETARNPELKESLLALWKELRTAAEERHRALAPEEKAESPNNSETGAVFDAREERARMGLEWTETTFPDVFGKSPTAGEFQPLPDSRARLMSMETFSAVLNDTNSRASNAQEVAFEEMMRWKPEMAATWLETAPLGDQAGARAARFAANWASEDPAAAAKWVSGLPPGDLAENTAANVARQYHEFAPTAARDWAASLPAGPVRDSAVSAMNK